MAEMHQRIKTELEFALQNPVLQKGEHGFVSDKNRFKIGDGVSKWNRLKYPNGGVNSGGGSGEPFPTGLEYIVVVPHGDNPNFPRPEDVLVCYWLGTVEPLNAIDDDQWSGEDNTGVVE